MAPYNTIEHWLQNPHNRFIPPIANSASICYLFWSNSLPKGQYILENIKTISDLIDYTGLNNMPGIIWCIDFEKAYDNIWWLNTNNKIQSTNIFMLHLIFETKGNSWQL